MEGEREGCTRIARSRIRNDERWDGEGRAGRAEVAGGREGVAWWLRWHTHAGAPFFLLSFVPASRFLRPCLPLDTATDNYALIVYPSPPPASSIRGTYSPLGAYTRACTYKSSRLVSVPVFPLLCPEPTVPHVRDTQWHIWC